MNSKIAQPQQIELLKAAMESCNCGITIADARDPEMPLIYINQAFETNTGYSKEETLGKNCRFLQGDLNNLKARAQIRQAFAQKKSTRVLLHNRRRDGTKFWNELHLSPVFSEGVLTHYVGVQNDITAEVEAKQQLQESRESLRLSLEEQQHLLGVAAHDLRNPLALVHSLAELAGDAAPEESRKIMETIMQVSQRALGMVGEILNLQAIQHGSIQLETREVVLSEFLEHYCESARTTCDLKEIELQPDFVNLPQRARFDPGRVERVLDNLLTNAVKYSHRGTRITLRARCNDTQLQLSVADQGQGIPEADLPKLFEPFTKINTTPTEGEHSSGLGLSISKRLVELHGGSIGVESTPGQGSTFTVCLPLGQ